MRSRLGRCTIAVLLSAVAVSGCSSSSSPGTKGGGCVFGVEWHGVEYVDPAADGITVAPPGVSGRYLGIGHDLCIDGGPSTTTWRLYAVPGISSDIAVTTKRGDYLGIAQGATIPAQLHPSRGADR
jgi:hypothetical protein